MEVRLYNPLAVRDHRALNFLTDFTRVNRRMHNKSFTADNQATVVGGRNIADEYFGAGGGLTFADLDVLAVGPAVQEVSTEFDVYWNSASAYPASGLVGPPAPDAAANLEARFAANRAEPESIAYADAVRASPLMGELLDRKLGLEWTSAEVVYDDPAKTLDTTERTDVLLFPALVRKMGRPEKTLDIVSPYFVPGAGGTEHLAALAKRGVTVRILTNSLAASDEKSVHSGYAKRRRDLLQAGVLLYEIKPNLTKQKGESGNRFGSGSSSGLHAKTLAVDRSRIFVGSFNFDQRSVRLNTEMGLVIGSPVLAGGLARFFDVEVPMLAYEVKLAPDGSSLEWIERTSTGETRYDTEPETSWATRMGVEFMSILPIEWLL
ncbi:MAG: phospholipase D family protein [Burkholderiales bacterium]|nr:phospholipase D family protein [Burkholderiales bacterium]